MNRRQGGESKTGLSSSSSSPSSLSPSLLLSLGGLQRDEDAALVPLLQAAQEVASNYNNNSNNSDINNNNHNSSLAVIRSIVMKVLTEPNLFYGYNQIHAILRPALVGGTTTSSVSSYSEEGQKLLQTLDLFSYGTYRDYHQNKRLYLDLTLAQICKLRQLTVLSVVQEACLAKVPVISYQEFATALGLVDDTEEDELNAVVSGDGVEDGRVEEILISCLYKGVLHGGGGGGKLCQQSRSLHLSPCFTVTARDVAPSSLGNLIHQVQALQSKLDGAVVQLTLQKEQGLQELSDWEQFWHQAEERRQKNQSSAATAAETAHPQPPVRGVGVWGDVEVSPLFGGGEGGVGGRSSRRHKRGRANDNLARFQA